MTLHHVRVAHNGLGLAAGLSVLDTRITVGGYTGRVRAVMADGPDNLLITLDESMPAKCPRCGHDNPADPTRTLDGDHAVQVEGPLSYDRQFSLDDVDTQTNTVRWTVHQPFILVRCSELDRTLAELNPTREATP